MKGSFIKPGLIVCDRTQPLSTGLAIVVGPAKCDGKFQICRWRGWRGITSYWSLPVTIREERLVVLDDWTIMPLTEAKRLSSAAYEWNYLVRALELAKGSVVEAARLAGLDRLNFHRLLERHGLANKPAVKNSKKKSRRKPRRNLEETSLGATES